MTALSTRLSPAGQWLMRKLFVAFDFFWPWLENYTPAQKLVLEKSLQDDEARIDALDFTKDDDVALEEARRLADSEEARRRGTDQKAATYLPLVAALIPLVLTLVSALWEKKAGSAPIWLNMVLLGLAVAYTASAGLWAFRELKVAVAHGPGLSDFEKSWAVPHPGQTLARRLLLHTRRNRDGVNWKVTCIKMAHEFLLRAFLTFSLLLLVNIGWYLTGLATHVWASHETRLTTPRQAVSAIAELDGLATQLKAATAWTVLADDCRTRTADQATLEFSADQQETPTEIPTVLQPEVGETASVQNIHLACAGRAIGQMRIWSITPRLAKLKRARGLATTLAAQATDAVVALTRNWPPSDTNADPAPLPTILLQQAVLRRDAAGQPVALAITAILPGAVTLP